MNALLIAALLAGTPDVKTQLTQQMEKWVKDFNSHKPAVIASHYADDVEFVYTFDGQEGRTRKGIEAFYTQAYQASPDLTVKLVSYEVVQLSDTLAFGSGTFEDTFTGPDGKKMTVPTHASEVFVKKGGKWVVRVDHASFVPPPQPPPPAAPKK